MPKKSISFLLSLASLLCFGGSLSMCATPQKSAGGFGLDQHKALVRRWIEEGFNRRDLKVVDEIFVDDFIVNGQGIGRGGLKQSMSRYLTAFPDLRVTITEIVAEGNKVGIWYTVQGTQKGEFEGFRPTDKQVSWFGADLLRLASGKIVDGRFVDDSLGALSSTWRDAFTFPIKSSVRYSYLSALSLRVQRGFVGCAVLRYLA
jgi:predicted ester cyclase